MTLQSVKEAVERLRSLNEKDEFAYEEAFRAFQSVKNIPVTIDVIPAGTAIIRSRPHYEGETFFEKVSDISIAPSVAVKNYGRCNKPFQSKFYGSENRPTSYIEQVEYWIRSCKPEEKVLVTLGQWITQKDLKLVIVVTPDKIMRTLPYDKYYGEGLDSTLARYQPEEREPAILFYRFLFEMFREPNPHSSKTYIITTAYCNLALHLARDQADGMMYPSVRSGKQGINFALNQNAATHDFLSLKSVVRNELTTYLNDQGMMSFRETGIMHAKAVNVSTNQIDW